MQEKLQKTINADPVEEILNWCFKARGGNKKVPVFVKKDPEINIANVVYWTSLMATREEIAASLGVKSETLEKAIIKKLGISFSQLARACEGRGKISLRRTQLVLARKSSAMAIWLGKQHLGQKEPEQKDKAPPNDSKLERLFCLMRDANV